MKKHCSLVAAALLLPAAASAAPLEISHAWFRALPGHLPAGGYFTLANHMARPVTLTGASAPACGSIMLHRSTSMGGMESMHMVAHVTVPAHGTLVFSPGGYHLMCMDPKPALKPGATVTVTLRLGGGGQLAAPFQVRDARGK